MPIKKTPTRLYINREYISFITRFSKADFFDFCTKKSDLLKKSFCTLWFYNNNYFLLVKTPKAKHDQIKYTLLEWGEQAKIQTPAFYTEYAKEICKGKGANRLFSALYN